MSRRYFHAGQRRGSPVAIRCPVLQGYRWARREPFDRSQYPVASASSNRYEPDLIAACSAGNPGLQINRHEKAVAKSAWSIPVRFRRAPTAGQHQTKKRPKPLLLLGFPAFFGAVRAWSTRLGMVAAPAFCGYALRRLTPYPFPYPQTWGISGYAPRTLRDKRTTKNRARARFKGDQRASRDAVLVEVAGVEPASEGA